MLTKLLKSHLQTLFLLVCISFGFAFEVSLQRVSAEVPANTSDLSEMPEESSPVRSSSAIPRSQIKSPGLATDILEKRSNDDFTPGSCPGPQTVVSKRTICQTDLTIPSFWWEKALEKYGGYLFIDWLAHPSNNDNYARVDLVVNQQLWSLLNYLERYEVVNEFGLAASAYGYHMRVFSRRGDFLAAYTCDFEVTPAVQQGESRSPQTVSRKNCRIDLDDAERGRLRGGSSPFSE